DAVCLRSIAGGQATELEMVAVDRDVVRGDGDRAAAAGTDVGGQVPAQAPHALGGDDRGYRIDEARAVVEGFGGGCRPGRWQQEGGQGQAGRERGAENGHGGCRCVGFSNQIRPARAATDSPRTPRVGTSGRWGCVLFQRWTRRPGASGHADAGRWLPRLSRRRYAPAAARAWPGPASV